VWQTAIPSYLRIRDTNGNIYRITVNNSGTVIAEAEQEAQ
jgi:hypothetical protein